MKRVFYLLLCVSLLSPCLSEEGEELDPSERKEFGEGLSLREAAVFFASVSKHVMDNYVEDTTNEALLENALKGMLGYLDPHSDYLSRARYKELTDQTKGKFGGLGIEVTMDDGLVKVIAPLEGEPADKAGIQAGDLIIQIDEKPVYGMSLQKAVDLMKGDPGTGIKVIVRRQGKSDFEVAMTRAIIEAVPVKARVEEDVLYVRISTFNENTAKEIKQAVKKFRRELGPKLEGIVLDVRNNAGGLLDQATATASLFIDGKDVVTIRARNARKTMRIKARSGDIADGLPMAVLINAGSASSSEILAGALQDHNRAIVLGTKSFGKGSVQTVVPLTNGGALKLTTALYFTPKGRSIQKEGIDPDIVIEQAVDLKVLEEEDRLREASFDSAIENGNKKKSDEAKLKKDKKKDKDKKDEELVDYQLERAIDVLRGMSFYRKNRSA